MFYYRLLCTFLLSQNFLDFASAGQRKTRIVGSGDTRTPRGYPFMVSFELNGKHACGGTILHEFLILTAAHCFYLPKRGSNPQYTIRAGSLDRENGGQVVKVKEYIIHEKYNSGGIPPFDVAILRLEQPLLFEEGVVGRVRLAKGDLPVGQQATVLGWGDISEKGLLSDWLRNISVTILDQKTCSVSYENFNATEYAAFCAGDFEYGGVDSCSSDSGGPLILESDGRQVGIVSYGRGCARSHSPGVYANVIQMRKWIGRTKSEFKFRLADELRSDKSHNKEQNHIQNNKTNVKFETMSYEPPYLVSIKLNGNHVCGGTILNEHVILTAATCLSSAKKTDVSSYTVQAGNLFGEKNSQISNIKEYEIHPKYKFGEINSYDAAILKLEKPLNFSTGNVRKINLVDNGKFPFFKDAIAFEWHNVNSKLSTVSGLRNVTLTILDQDICSLVNNYKNVTEYGLFCADDFGKGEFDSCAGDNGGPLILESDGSQIGIVSFIVACGDESLKPRLFTNIMEIRKWINGTITKFTYRVSDKPYFHSYLKRTELKRIDGFRGTFLEDYDKHFRN